MLARMRGSENLAWLPLVVFGGGSILAGLAVALRGDAGLFPLYSGPWLMVIVTILVTLTVAATGDCVALHRLVPCGVMEEATPVADSIDFDRHPVKTAPRESIPLPTLQTSTCNCVIHQPLQHFEREEGPAKAPAISVLPLRGRESCRDAATGDSRPFPRERVLARLSHGPP